jgi:hypothetical protein
VGSAARGLHRECGLSTQDRPDLVPGELFGADLVVIHTGVVQ